MGVQPLKIRAVRGGFYGKHRDSRLLQGALNPVAGGVQQHQIGLQLLDSCSVAGVHLGQLLQAGLGAVAAGPGQLSLTAQGQQHIRQAGRENHRPGGSGRDGHAVDLHRERSASRHPRNNVVHLRTAGKGAAAQKHTERKG